MFIALYSLWHWHSLRSYGQFCVFAPARVPDTFDNPINIYEALYWNNTELLYTCTCVSVCVWMQHKTSNKRNTRTSIVSRRTCRELHGIWRSCAGYGCCCCCSHIAHTHHSTVAVLWCGQRVREIERERERASECSHCFFDFLIILKAMSALCWLQHTSQHPLVIACVCVCVHAFMYVCVCSHA